jgi:hypothetical protein
MISTYIYEPTAFTSSGFITTVFVIGDCFTPLVLISKEFGFAAISTDVFTEGKVVFRRFPTVCSKKASYLLKHIFAGTSV